MYQVNPMQLIQMFKSGKNPQQLILTILQQNAQGNPLRRRREARKAGRYRL